jgi:hypothetical protein
MLDGGSISRLAFNRFIEVLHVSVEETMTKNDGIKPFADRTNPYHPLLAKTVLGSIPESPG